MFKMMRCAGAVALTALLSCTVTGPVSAQFAPGVQQSAAQTANVNGTVTDASGHGVAGANVRLQGQITLTAKSDAQGAFAFVSAPDGPYEITVTSNSLGNATQRIYVNGDITVAVKFSAQGGAKVIGRVSAASSGAHINVTAASVSSVTPSDFAFQGNTQWRRLLEGIPGVVAGGSLAGGGTTIANVPDGPLQPEILSINGALPYETATTLDGMPLSAISWGGSPGSGVDLSILPMSAFDTADVVRGPGANAPSIIDSVGGSFVLHSPGRVNKNSFELSTSNDAYGGNVTNVRAAYRWGHLSATAVAGWNVSPGPSGSETALAALFGAPATINGAPVSGGGLVSAAVSPTYNSVYQYTTSLVIDGYPQNTRWVEHTGGIGLSYDVTPSVAVSAFYAGHAAGMDQATFYFPTTFAPAAGYSGSLPPGNYSNLYFATQPNYDSESSGLFEEKLTANIGNGVLRLGALQGASDTLQLYSPSIPFGTYNVYGTVYYASAPKVPVTFNGTPQQLTFAPFNYYDNTQAYNRDLLASYETQLGADSTLGFSFVRSYTGYQDYQNEAGALSIVPSGVDQANEEYRLHASHTFANRLTVDGSYYLVTGSFHEPNPANRSLFVDPGFHYSAPRLGIVYKAGDNAAIRLSAGGGFAIPPIKYLNGTNSIAACSGVTFTCTSTVTNINLQPETSFSYDIGTDVRLQRDTALSLDLYRTNLFGQIFSSVSYAGLNAMNGFPTYAKEYLNLTRSRFEGLNVEVHHDPRKGVYWKASLGLTRGYVIAVPPGFYNTAGNVCNTVTAAGCTNTYIIPGANYDGEFQSTVPYANGRATVGYRWSPQSSFDIEPTYIGNNNAYFQPAFVAVDAHGSLRLSKNVTLDATMRNIFGIHDQSYAGLYQQLSGAPVIVGKPYGLSGLPYGPRTGIVTLNVKL